jgi:hypothetical protein
VGTWKPPTSPQPTPTDDTLEGNKSKMDWLFETPLYIVVAVVAVALAAYICVRGCSLLRRGRYQYDTVSLDDVDMQGDDDEDEVGGSDPEWDSD